MKNPQIPLLFRLILGAVACVASHALIAASPDARACNLQGREIALRISEEVSSDLTTADRARIATIAEEVCSEYRPAAPAADMPVVSRPAAPQPAPQAVTVPATPEPAATDEEEDGGLFDLKIIDPDDRVRRPGLKRP